MPGNLLALHLRLGDRRSGTELVRIEEGRGRRLARCGAAPEEQWEESCGDAAAGTEVHRRDPFDPPNLASRVRRRQSRSATAASLPAPSASQAGGTGSGTIRRQARSRRVVLRHANLWVILSASGILLLGVLLLALPSSSIGPNARFSGWVLLGAGLLELLGALARRRPPVRKIELLLGAVTIGAAVLILVRPQAYPLLFVAIICLLLRGMGAVAAGFMSRGTIRAWVVGRGLFDLALGGILVAGAPLAAVISIVSGNRWPDRSGAVLTNFVALSMLVTGFTLLGLALTAGRGRGRAAQARDEES
jgi:uncharacterized membrane protein HdeD (DUF308 family)